MRKRVYVAAVFAICMLSACGNQADDPNGSAREERGGNLAEGTVSLELDIAAEGSVPAMGTAASNPSEAEQKESITAIQEGKAGTLQVALPAGWSYDACPEGSDQLRVGDYGIHFYPEDVSEGFIELCYKDFFGVCGTGLEQEKVTLAGDAANIGTYDNGDNWDFVSFHGTNEGIVALTYAVEGWWPEYGEQVLEILDTVCLKRDFIDGTGVPSENGAAAETASESDVPAICGYPTIDCWTDREPSENLREYATEDSRIEELGLSLEVKECTNTGATLIFRQNGGSPTGELSFGDTYSIERYEDSEWVEVPLVVTGNYGFHMIAYNIPLGEDREFQIDWEWLYGELEAGEYRIRKDVDDFRKTADYDVYEIYAYFEI